MKGKGRRRYHLCVESMLLEDLTVQQAVLEAEDSATEEQEVAIAEEEENLVGEEELDGPVTGNE